jgi:hypothetical protein
MSASRLPCALLAFLSQFISIHPICKSSTPSKSLALFIVTRRGSRLFLKEPHVWGSYRIMDELRQHMLCVFFLHFVDSLHPSYKRLSNLKKQSLFVDCLTSVAHGFFLSRTPALLLVGLQRMYELRRQCVVLHSCCVVLVFSVSL